MNWKQRLAWLAMRGSLGAVAALPLKALYGVSSALAVVLHKGVKYRRKVVRQNLDVCFPELPIKERRELERRFYVHLADTMAESVKLLNISNEELDRRIEVVNAELIDRLAAEGRSVILYLAHYGNWEWVPWVATKYTPAIKSMHVYKPLRDVASQRIFDLMRSRFNSEGVVQDEVMRSLIRRRREGELFMCGFISDHRANVSDTHHRLMFLGQSTQVLTGAEAIGRKLGTAFVYLDIEQPRRGYYRLTFKEMMQKDLDPNWVDMKYTRLYHKLLEATIRREPRLWLWSHRRWLYK